MSPRSSCLFALVFPLFLGHLGAQPAPAPFDGAGRPNRSQTGPWDNDVLVLRVTPEGRVETLATFERAGVPTLARLAEGRLIAAHQHFPENDDANFDKVALRFSTDEGRTWTAPEVLRLTGLPEGMRFPFDPTLVPLPDGRVRLYFTSLKGRRFEEDRPAIYSAVSGNGLDYQVEPGIRFGLAGRPVIDCAVVLHRGVFHLFAPDHGTGGPGGGPGPGPASPQPQASAGTGYHATSADGLAFTRQEDVRVPGARRWLGNAVSEGERMRFVGTGGPQGLWSATSPDGQSWQLDEAFGHAPGADPGAVRLRDGSWLIAATGPPRGRPRPAFAGPAGAGGPGNPRRLFTRVPSQAAGTEGLAVGILLPPAPRYPEGAPVAIHVTGGVQAGSAGGRPEYVGLGFVELHFAFPGGGQGDERSGGTYDFRGPGCIRALADVIGFATGRRPDQDGRRIQGLAGALRVLTRNCGVIGSSHGGNACGLAMALHGDEFPDLPWYASMESPYGEGAANVELGGHESGVNPAYNPENGTLDLARLAWSDALEPGLFRKPMPGATPPLRGAFFFDLDRDGRFTRDGDFPANCFVGDDGRGVKAWYSPRILAAADQRRLISGSRPGHVPTLGESKAFWRYRDAAPSIPEALRHCTNLAVIVYANERDHVQAAPDHSHILVQVEGFRTAGARFVRLNPDRAYVERLVARLPAARADGGEGTGAFPDNPAGTAFDRSNVRPALEPPRFPLGLYMQAAVCELADRTQAGQWAPNLDAVLYPEAPMPGPLPAAQPPGGGAPFPPGGVPNRRSP